ncbi:hypothetical protein VNO77_11393 [Canavalia gladiata]|uniref:Uncharacterized protein n=1 Tax=Canavalia gladiata TaxID=3824 RepID=A0AAN9MC41_CANGL
MARGKIQIKRIENTTNRQVTYSKRRNGLFKKANELTVLCDAKVSIIMFSSTGKLHEYISPSTSTKQFFDQYQMTLGIDLWTSHYENMQENLKKLKEVNRNLRKEIRQRMGDCLNDLSMEDLKFLEEEMDKAAKVVRERKYKVITNQIDTQRKKCNNEVQVHNRLLRDLDARAEDPRYGLLENGGEYESIIGLSNLGPRMFALSLQPTHPNAHSGAGSDLTTYPLLFYLRLQVRARVTFTQGFEFASGIETTKTREIQRECGAMGALATFAPWTPEDDLLLKNAVEAGASLESLAKGAVQFSRRYGIREIQDRWYSLLYDPVISAEASACMTNFELSASPLPSKFFKFGPSKERKVVSVKRKSESVRTLYYAMRKRIHNNSLTSMDLSFLVDPENGNYVVNGSEPLSENCIPESATANHFSNLDPPEYAFPENMMDDNVASNGVTAHAYCTGVDNPVEENFPVEQKSILKEEPQILGDNMSLNGAAEDLDVPKELAIDGWIGDNSLERMPLSTLDHINHDPGNLCSEFDEDNVFDSPELECGTSFNLSPLPEMPIWKTDESIQESDMPCDGFQNSIDCGEAYLAELSNSLFNFSSDEEFFLMDVNGKDGIENSYYDGLSSLLLNSPNGVNPDQIPKKDETGTLMASEAHAINVSVSCHAEVDDNPGSHSSGAQVVHKSDFPMPSSTSAKDPQFPELINGIICCTLNTEDPEVPSNDDVFLPFDEPPSIFSSLPKSTFKELNRPVSSSVQDYGFNNDRASERAKILMHVEKKTPVESHASSQMMGSHCFPGPAGGSKVKCELPASHTSHTVSKGAVTVSGGLGGNDAATTADGLLHSNQKEEATNVGLVKHLNSHVTNSLIKKSATGSNDFKNHPQPNGSSMKNEHELTLPLQDHQLQHAEVRSSDVPGSEPVVNPLTLDEEEQYIESDDEIPSYSDVEAMVLDMDLDPDDDQDSPCNEEVSRYQHAESKRAIMRLEQGARSCIQRAIDTHGAFAILYGRHSKHYIKKTEVLLGRATEGVPVDIDLGKGGYSNAISRRQAIIKMDKDGSFYIKNFGKSSILVNSKEVHTGQSQKLHSNYLIEVRGMPLIFEINESRVKQYLDHISDNSQTL